MTIKQTPISNASEYDVGKRKKGVDGKFWRVMQTKKGIKKWETITKKKPSTKRKPIDKPSQKPPVPKKTYKKSKTKPPVVPEKRSNPLIKKELFLSQLSDDEKQEQIEMNESFDGTHDEPIWDFPSNVSIDMITLLTKHTIQLLDKNIIYQVLAGQWYNESKPFCFKHYNPVGIEKHGPDGKTIYYFKPCCLTGDEIDISPLVYQSESGIFYWGDDNPIWLLHPTHGDKILSVGKRTLIFNSD